MATTGSFRKLKENSIAAVSAAIEIYNKPKISYREEVVVILVINSWELILKSLIIRSKGKIFQRKKRNCERLSITFWEAYSQATKSKFWPTSLDPKLVRDNLELLNDFRNNVVHFYSDNDTGPVMHLALSASIRNMSQLLLEAFEHNLADEVNLTILPVGNLNTTELVENLLQPQMSLGGKPDGSILRLVAEKLSQLDPSTPNLGQFLVGVNVELRSVKSNFKNSKVFVSVVGEDAFEGSRVLIRDRDPNITHPLTFTDLATVLKAKHNLGRNHLSAFIQKYKYQEEPNLCWIDGRTRTKRYSHTMRHILETSALSDFTLPGKARSIRS